MSWIHSAKAHSFSCSVHNWNDLLKFNPKVLDNSFSAIKLWTYIETIKNMVTLVLTK